MYKFRSKPVEDRTRQRSLHITAQHYRDTKMNKTRRKKCFGVQKTLDLGMELKKAQEQDKDYTTQKKSILQ